MILCTNNLLRDATITVNGAMTQYPASNLYSQSISGFGGVAAYNDNILIDLGSLQNIKAIGYLNSSATISIQAQTVEVFVNGTDGSLNNPDGTNSVSGFVPAMNTSTGNCVLNIGDGTVPGYVDGSFDSWSNDPTTYGSVYFSTPSGNWDSFSAYSNGSKTITFPDSQGYLYMYYNATAFSTAFNGNTDDIVLGTSGSVYKGSISDANLVTDINGNIGVAGGGTFDPELDGGVYWGGNLGYELSPTTYVTEIDETYQYWRIKTSETGTQYLGTFYLGDPLKCEYHNVGTLATNLYNDKKNISGSGRYFGSYGILRKREAFTVTSATETEFIEWNDFITDDDERINPFIFTRFENDQTDPYLPYFAKIEFNTNGREGRPIYRFNFTIEEVK